MPYQRQYWNDYDESVSETINIERGAVVTPERMNNLESGIVNNHIELEIKKADKTYVDTVLSSIASGGPKGLFYSLAALRAKYPNGAEGTYLVFDAMHTDSAHSYMWNGNQWEDLGPYQGREIPDGSIDTAKYRDKSVTIDKLNDSIFSMSVGGNMSEIPVKLQWEKGGITETGVNIPYPERNDIIRSVGYIENCNIIYVDVNNFTGSRWALHRYDKNNNHLEYVFGSSTRSVYTIDPDYNYRIMFAINGDIQIPNTVGRSVSVYKNVESFKLQQGAIEERHLSESIKQFLTPNSTKYMHISVDDVIGIFKDIKDNQYTSIFNHPTLAFFKQLHDEFSTVFSMYCFYENSDASFNLGQMTSNYANEFRENADWLKFGVHYYKNGYDNFGNIDPDLGIEHYETIINELHRIVGGFEALDLMPRFHNYAGSLEFIEKVSQINLGIKGLITSEDNRQNYHLSSKQNTYMQLHDSLYDSDNFIKLASTDLRLENVSDVKSTLNNRISSLSYASRNEGILIFTHEPFLSQQTMQIKMRDACEFARDNDYRFDYPINH